ncbi:NAD-dependent epimerase/dehydratase family protein [Streptomyces sp. NPDC054770]
MSSALITGGAGFVGGHLATALRGAGIEVRNIDDLRVTPLIAPPEDLLRKSVLEMGPDDVADVDVVYHLASEKSVPLSFERPLQYLENLESTTHLLKLCAGAGVRRVIIASTCEVYGQAEKLPTDEAQPFAPRSPYAASKVAMEMVTKTFQQAAATDTAATIVRFFNVYGPGERPDAVIPRFCVGALTDRSLPIEGTGVQRRDFSYIGDIVQRLVALPSVEPVPVVNLGSGTATSILEVGSIIRSLCPDSTVDWTQPRTNEIQEFRADVSLQQCLLPVGTPTTGLREGVSRTLRWWQELGRLDSVEAHLAEASRTLPATA